MKGLRSYSQVKWQGSQPSHDTHTSYPEYPNYPHRNHSISLKPSSLISHPISPISWYRTSTTMPSTVTTTTANTITTTGSTTHHWSGLVSVQTYPRHQTLLVGYDAVLQCRDEGLLRREVFWQRRGGRQLPSKATQHRGRLEILGVTREDGGDYECVAEGYEHQDGGKQISTISIQ